LKVFPRPSRAIAVPRARVERVLVGALNKDGLTNLRTVAASVGLSSTRRFYKDFRDLRLAIVAKNREIRKKQVRALRTALSLERNSVPHRQA
jgi:DNA-binding transcriptional regulator YbjK